MLILPAIDILHGKVVRLFQGDYEKATYYPSTPEKIARTFAQAGYSSLHVIDLAGAKAGSPQALKEVKDILSLGLDIQIGGGIRTLESAHEYISLGVRRLIIGTQALLNPSFIDELIRTFGTDSIAISLDVRSGKLATHGWTAEHSLSLNEFLLQLEKQGVKHVIVTDIARDGTLSGVNSDMYRSLVDEFPHINFYAAGGVSSQIDIDTLTHAGVSGVIIGKAFYEQRIGI